MSNEDAVMEPQWLLLGVLLGVAVGWVAGSIVLGLVFGISCGVMAGVVAHRRRLRHPGAGRAGTERRR